MSLKNYSREELEVTSMLELAGEIMHDEQKAQNFNDLYGKVTELKGYTDEQKREFIAQFYTDLTLDGRFLTIESDVWGLKRWYPVEQMDEIVTSPEPEKKKKTKKKKKKEKVQPEQPEEGGLDTADDNVEILTNKFEDEVVDERDESADDTGFDDEIDDDDDFDDDDFDDSEEEEEDNN
ncbi:putative DNA-directed RNA polymerase subunit delta [Lentibacillus kapialis]|uniref:Probable DNA-directed RNA polymerase subunit delta n=1 Tax=Lentibacillus kapialis TaxID=340214 RepID=A0A917V175_9BACI|nr:DNA-directed RNA polymerase subunit delta [Lentibacillus kapialis]GGK07581.1 putative DNA-directed RNA polymerase subunit delta [Lentibacillus kapialis]